MDYWYGECPGCGSDVYSEEDGSNATCFVCENEQMTRKTEPLLDASQTIYVVTRTWWYGEYNEVMKAFANENDANEYVEEMFNSDLSGSFEYHRCELI